MNTRTIKIILIAFALAIVVFVVLGVYPLFSDIQEQSQQFILYKKSREELALRMNELAASQDLPSYYPIVRPIEPLDFVEFLEKEAEATNLYVKTTAFPPKKEEAWLAADFGLDLSGSPSDFLTFLEKLESASYLINISSFNILKGEEENTIQASLSGKVYGKAF